MFKNKRFLNGFGFGLIIGALLLQVMVAAQYQGKTVEPDDVGKIKELAQANHLEVYSQDELDKELEKRIAAKSQANSSKPPAPQTTPSIKTTVSPKAASTASSSTAATPKPPEVTKTIEIIEGMTSAEVTNLFFTKGIIEDKASFQKELTKQQLDKIIQYGKYTFGSNEKITDIVKIITTPSQ